MRNEAQLIPTAATEIKTTIMAFLEAFVFLPYVPSSEARKTTSGMAMIGEKERIRREALKEGRSYSLLEFFMMTPEEGRIRGVYVLTDAKSGKSYVGQSRDVRKRITKQHFLEEGGAIVCKNVDFKEDFEEDRIGSWSVLIIESQGDLNLLERETIRKLDSAGSGYNKTIGNID